MHPLILTCLGIAALIVLVRSIDKRFTEAGRSMRWHLIPAAATMAIGVPWTSLMGGNLIRMVGHAAETLYFSPGSPRQLLWIPAGLFLGLGFSAGLASVAASFSSTDSGGW